MARMQRIHRIKVSVDHVLGGTVALLMGLLVVDVLWQVFTRFVLSDPSRFTDELARFLLIWVGLLGGAYGVGQRLHLAIDLLPTKLTGRPHHLLMIVIEATVMVFAVAVLVVGGARLVGLTLLMGQTSAAMQVPLGLVYSVLPLSGILIAFYTLVFIGDHLKALRTRPPGAAEPTPIEAPADLATPTSYE
jgi:TRAP-type C4-dicarboxylate transport system permease small subunit